MAFWGEWLYVFDHFEFDFSSCIKDESAAAAAAIAAATSASEADVDTATGGASIPSPPKGIAGWLRLDAGAAGFARRTKRIRFAKTCAVILIPSRAGTTACPAWKCTSPSYSHAPHLPPFATRVLQRGHLAVVRPDGPESDPAVRRARGEGPHGG